ncbi:MAG: DNA alkylation repair protein [Planctomycetaceae bacterium]
MTLRQVLKQLQQLGNETTRAHNRKWGAGENQYGVKHGDIRELARQLRTHPGLAEPLWKTGNLDAQLLAVLLIPPRRLSADELEAMVHTISFSQVADWLCSYVVKTHPQKEDLRQRWLHSADKWASRVGWWLTAERVAKDREGLDLRGLLARIEVELAGADPVVQWTMNNTLAAIGIESVTHRRKALEIGERLGVYKDYPASRGCISPFAPIWIAAMVDRNKAAKK